MATNAPIKSESDVVNANAAAILRAGSAASGVGGVAGVEVAAAAAAPEVEPSVTSTAINNVAIARPIGRVRVSRKKTSSVRMPTHLVRRRPAKYPPKADDSNWVTTSHIAATVPKVVGDGLVKDHGEMVARPRPGPRVNRRGRVVKCCHQTNPGTAPRPECCSDFTEENEHKDYYENYTENPGRAVSPGAAIAPSRKSPYEHEDKKN
jgi:hypothetical protein